MEGWVLGERDQASSRLRWEGEMRVMLRGLCLVVYSLVVEWALMVMFMPEPCVAINMGYMYICLQ